MAEKIFEELKNLARLEEIANQADVIIYAVCDDGMTIIAPWEMFKEIRTK